MTARWDTKAVQELYDEAAGHWRLLGLVDSVLLVNRLRKKHFSTAMGQVLDVACGTGENFEYLEGAVSVTAFDLSAEMIEEARRRTRQMRADIDFAVGDAEQMPFSDERFDTVISAFSTCTIPDYASAFREMVRVTRPGGRVLLLEHGRSSVGWISRRQDRRIKQVCERSACRNNRDVAADLTVAGLEPSSHLTSHLGMMNRVTIDVTEPSDADTRS